MISPYRTPEVMAVANYQPFSGERTTCRKCSRQGGTFNKWQAESSLLERQCMSCEYTWLELPADAGSPSGSVSK